VCVLACSPGSSKDRDCALQAEKKMLEANYNKEYLPIEGLAEFRKATIDLMLGPNSKAQQEVRGLRPTTRKLQRQRKRATVFLSSGSARGRLWVGNAVLA
jgi:aspartate/tyrosine/aromatic aminotransferase